MANNAALEAMTAQTLEDVIKGATTGILAGTGLTGVDLAPFVSLVPVNVPARNNTGAFPRKIAGMGAKYAQWRALLNINATQTDPAVGLDYAGSETKFLEQTVEAAYKPLAKFGRVTQTAIAIAQNYIDALSVGELQTLNQLFIGQDIHIINSQVYALPAITEPTAVLHTTGGTIPKTTPVHIKVAARSGWNYYYGKSGAASAQRTVTPITTTTNKITASVKAVKGAVAYDWFVATHYYTTTSVNTVTITFVPTANQPLPTALLNAGMSKVAPTTPPAATHSFSTNCYAGVLASDLADYGATGQPVTPGTGTAPSGCVWLSLDGAQPVLQGSGVSILDKLCYQIWGNVQLSPTAFMMNAEQANDISQLVLGTTAATTFLPPTDSDARTNLAAGGFVGRYINRAAGGVPVAIEVHTHVPPGTIIARTDRVPFPGSNIGTVFEVRCEYDTMRFDYAANYAPTTVGGGPRYDFEIRSMETLVNRAPGAQAIACNVGALDTTY